MTDMQAADTCAVVVTYHPDPSVLADLLAALAPQVAATVVVDNGSDEAVLASLVAATGAVLLPQRQNLGLAKAHNLGIAWAREHGFGHVLLSDQDSIPDAGMVDVLLAALGRLRHEGSPAAVGPVFHDLREDREAPFVRVGFPVNRKLRCEYPGQIVACDFLISSGALIPLDVIDAVGAMNEGLFIDNIDLEWSFRARAHGYTLHGVCAAAMHHRLGDARRSLPLGLGQVVVHGPARLYYMMRNRLRLYRMPHTPRVWVIQDVPRVLAKLVLFGVLIGPRLRNLHFMLRGIWDGLRNREGACPLS